MSNKKTTAEPKKLREIFYDNIRFNAGYEAQFGQAHCNQLGRLECSTEKHATPYSASWIMGAPVVFVRWLTTKGDIKERHIPWGNIMVAEVIAENDKPAALAKRR